MQFTSLTIERKVSILPSQYNKDFKDVIVDKLKKEYVSTWTNECYIHSIQSGAVYPIGMVSFNGKDIMYNVRITFNTINLKIGEIYPGIVEKTNEDGINVVVYDFIRIFIRNKKKIKAGKEVKIKILNKAYIDKSITFTAEIVSND